MENTLIQVNKNGMGSGDEALGLLLLNNYFKLINEENKLPRFIAFYNAGAKIVAEGSPCIDILKTMESRGVKLIACKTCLVHFDLLDKVQTGIAGTMMDIIELQKVADKVINL